MADIRQPNERYEKIAEELIEGHGSLADIAASDVRIAYLSSGQAKRSCGKLVFGQCEKVPARFQWAVPFDFMVTVFEPNVSRFSEEQMRTLILHELMHVGVRVDDDGAEHYSIVPHDIGEFNGIAEEYGLKWWS